MIKIECVDILGWEAAIRGMRNPMNSWGKSDSYWFDEFYIIGPDDLGLATKLANAGHDHGKFLRMLHVQMDITAPLYWWKQADAYKVGTATNSTSTMHRIHAKEFTLDDFSHEHMGSVAETELRYTVGSLNRLRSIYLYGGEMGNVEMETMRYEPKAKEVWWQMIQLLPSSYNQKRTWDGNYAVLRAMYHARKNHKLDEWRDFCKWVEDLPYAKELIVGEGEYV